ncbi:SDR family oxidoreductase [archaeon]|nr:SDR family oxidoreductase [archaeon]
MAQANFLSGKIILITGSARGIGAATAKVAKKYGAEVILHGKSESENLKKLAVELNSKYIFCDITNELQVRKSVEKFQKIDVLINSAGINISKSFEDLTNEDWLNVFKANVLGTVNFSNAVIPKMRDAKFGKIVNISSAKGYLSASGRAAYSSSKAAVINLTASMAKELSPEIIVNGIAPGFTNTEMTAGTWSPRVREHIDKTLLKRMAKPEEIAEAILFLASDRSNYIAGQTILVDGGFTIGI